MRYYETTSTPLASRDELLDLLRHAASASGLAANVDYAKRMISLLDKPCEIAGCRQAGYAVMGHQGRLTTMCHGHWARASSLAPAPAAHTAAPVSLTRLVQQQLQVGRDRARLQRFHAARVAIITDDAHARANEQNLRAIDRLTHTNSHREHLFTTGATNSVTYYGAR